MNWESAIGFALRFLVISCIVGAAWGFARYGVKNNAFSSSWRDYFIIPVATLLYGFVAALFLAELLPDYPSRPRPESTDAELRRYAASVDELREYAGAGLILACVAASAFGVRCGRGPFK